MDSSDVRFILYIPASVVRTLSRIRKIGGFYCVDESRDKVVSKDGKNHS